MVGEDASLGVAPTPCQWALELLGRVTAWPKPGYHIRKYGSLSVMSPALFDAAHATVSDVTTALEYSGAASLDGWTGHDWADGLQLDRLGELDELLVRTRNN